MNISCEYSHCLILSLKLGDFLIVYGESYAEALTANAVMLTTGGAWMWLWVACALLDVGRVWAGVGGRGRAWAGLTEPWQWPGGAWMWLWVACALLDVGGVWAGMGGRGRAWAGEGGRGLYGLTLTLHTMTYTALP